VLAHGCAPTGLAGAASAFCAAGWFSQGTVGAQWAGFAITRPDIKTDIVANTVGTPLRLFERTDIARLLMMNA
jgi:hypothetical protein